MPLCLESFAMLCMGVRSETPAVVAREARRGGLRVLGPLLPSLGAVRKGCCRLGMQVVALGQSWCGFRELWTNCFSGMPERCAGTRWDGDAVCISVISALIAAYTVAFCMLVWRAANSIGSLSHQPFLQRGHPGGKSWKSWRCDGLKSS